MPVDEHSSANHSHQVLVDVKTLNDIVSKGGLPIPDMVKIVPEGFNLKILPGASDLFGKTDVFLVEAVVFRVDYQNTLGSNSIVGRGMFRNCESQLYAFHKMFIAPGVTATALHCLKFTLPAVGHAYM